MENKIICPWCNQLDCYVEKVLDIESYLCLSCGYTTTSKHIDGSIDLRKWEQTTAELIKKSKKIDTATKLVWYPSVLNFQSKGIIFPDGTNEENWQWRVAHVVEVPEAEKSKYPIPGKEGEFYSTRIDLAGSKMFTKADFKNACFELGILEKE